LFYEYEPLCKFVSHSRGLARIHPGFRVLALGEPPVVGAATGQWLSPEMLALFLYHDMRPLTHSEEQEVISQLVSTGELCRYITAGE